MTKLTDFSQIPTLHLGPMSGRVIEATARFSVQNDWPICLIASRRQVDAKSVGGGYVDGLTTEQLAKRLNREVASGHIILARDHGGPYQRGEEESLSLDEALNAVESSYRTDIESGFSILHIDPEKCVSQGDAEGLQTFTDLTCELLGRCFNILKETGRDDVRFEVGSDEGIGMDFAPDQWAQFFEAISDFCDAHGRPKPVAMAVPLGSKVKELENVGGLALNPHDPFWTKRVQAMCAVAARFGTKLKLHNADYISPQVLKRYRELGVEQINVAPELGVIETRALLQFLRQNNLKPQAEAFLKIAYDSRKWERWLKPGSTASDEEKAIMAGHYVFATPAYRALLQSLPVTEYDALDRFLIAAITRGIANYHSLLEDAYAPSQNTLA